MQVPQPLKDLYRSARHEYDDARAALIRTDLPGVSQEAREKAAQHHRRAMTRYYALEDAVKAISNA